MADQRFPVSLARLVRATLQPEAAFIERHYANMGYWAIVIEPWVLDTGALRINTMVIGQSYIGPCGLPAPADVPAFTTVVEVELVLRVRLGCKGMSGLHRQPL